MSEPSLLSVRDLRTWFETDSGVVRAVDGVTFELARGEGLGIAGESGSGKTQTFFSLFGLTHGFPGIVSGSASFAGRDLLGGLEDYVDGPLDGSETSVNKRNHAWSRIHRERLRGLLGSEITMIFQEPASSMIPYWRVRQHLDKAVGGDQKAASDLLARLGFADPRRILDSFPGELSGGQAQRVMLALALAPKPKLLIADEPTTAVDALSQVRILDELQAAYHGTDLSLVLITHDLAVLRRLVSRVLVMYRGKMVEHLSVRELDEAPADALHPYTLELRESQARRANAEAIPELDLSRRSGGGTAAGCPYAGWCDLRRELDAETRARCGTEMPPFVQISKRHALACWGRTP